MSQRLTDDPPGYPRPREHLDRKTVLAIVAMGVAVIVIANDFTALSVALPAIEKDFHSELGTVQWTVNAYALVFGVLIVTGGRLADMFGRKRMFFAGTAIFALFSFLSGVAPSDLWLIAFRALMGIGGALMWPAILGMTYSALPPSRAGLAGGLILGAAGFGNAVGPLVGGLLTDLLSWRWIFLINVPIAAAAVAVTWVAIKQTEAPSERARLDYPGMATLSIGLVLLLLALDQASDWGWADVRVLALFAGSGILLLAFALIEGESGAAALIPGDVISNRPFAAACMAVLLTSAVFFAALLYLPQLMTRVLGYSALQSGAGLLPMMATFAAVSFASGPLYERFHAKVVVSCGAAAIAAGIFVLSIADRGSSYLLLVPGMLVLGIGIGLFYAAVTTAAVTALDPSRTSLAGGIVYMFQIAGGSIGLGVNTAIVLAGSSLAAGIQTAFRVDTVLTLCALAVSLIAVGGRLAPGKLSLPHQAHHRAIR